MTPISPISAMLVLEDGTVYRGQAAGKIGTTTGEICFNTGMTGYQEIFTDPSYFGQIMVATNAHIGNYGTHSGENESGTIKISGLVCKNFSASFSRKQATGSLQNFYLDQNIVSITGIDTRSLVRHIGEKGAMNAIISSEIFDLAQLHAMLKNVPSMDGLELSSHVSTKDSYEAGNSDAPFKVAVLDLGIKKSILKHLASRNLHLKVFPHQASYRQMKEWSPNGFFISNGPGDPAAMPYALEAVRAMLDQGDKLFGICLGHQLLAMACGISTYKMHNGHRGLNHPVKNIVRDRCEVTSQNHGFGISGDEVRHSQLVEVTHVNLNDGTVEGIRATGKPAFSVQYHPEASPGPHDSHYLFDEFTAMLGTSD